jgi:multiple sugar transport system substrate-binding protein
MFARVLIALGVTGALLGATTAAAIPASRPAAKVTISYWTYQGELSQPGLSQIVAGFEKKYPHVHVNTDIIQNASFFTKLSAAFAGNAAPDTFDIDVGDFPAYATNNEIMPLSKVASSSELNQIKSQFTRAALRGFSYKGRPEGLPQDFADTFLFYNKTLFRKAHVAYPTLHWSWKNELAAAKKLTNKSKGVYGIWEPVQFYEFYKVLHEAGGHFFTRNGKMGFDNKAGLNAINWLVDKTNKYHVMPSAAETGGLTDTQMLCDGKVAMDITGDWGFSSFASTCPKLNYNIQVEGGDVTHGTHYFADAVVINAHDSHAKAEAAYEFDKYYTTSALAATTRVKLYQQLLPLKNTKYEASYLKQRPPANRRAVFQALKWAVAQPILGTGVSESQMSNDVSTDLANVQDGTMSPQKVLNAMKSQIDSLPRH